MKTFVKEVATREASRAKILVDGTAGSGKTWTSLLLAAELGKETLVFDSENKSSTKYSHRFPFNVVKMPDYHPRTYSDAITFGESQQEDVLIFDGVSHSWAGEGGALELAEQNKIKVGGNKWAAWSHVTPDLNIFTHRILDCSKHLICTARVRTDWEEVNDGGKKKYNKIGLATVARQEFDYEFDLHFRMQADGTDHYLIVLKSRYDEIKVGEIVKNPDAEFARHLARVIAIGISPEAAAKKKALVYYQTLAAKAVELQIKFNHHTEESDIDAIKADGKRLRDEITAAEAKQAKPTAAKPEPGASPEAAPASSPKAAPQTPVPAIHPDATPEAAPPPGYLDSELMEEDAVDDLPSELFEDKETPAPSTKSGFSQPLFAAPLRGAPMPRENERGRPTTSNEAEPDRPAKPTRTAATRSAKPGQEPPTTDELRTALSRARSVDDLSAIASRMGKMVVFAARLQQILKSEGVSHYAEIKESRMATIVGALAGYLVDQLPKRRK